jgi:hypothetical protein
MHGSSQASKQGEIRDRIHRGPNRHEIANYFLEHRVNGRMSEIVQAPLRK